MRLMLTVCVSLRVCWFFKSEDKREGVRVRVAEKDERQEVETVRL